MRLIDADHLKKWIINRGLQYPLKTIDILEQIDRELTYTEEYKPEYAMLELDANRHVSWKDAMLELDANRSVSLSELYREDESK